MALYPPNLDVNMMGSVHTTFVTVYQQLLYARYRSTRIGSFHPHSTPMGVGASIRVVIWTWNTDELEDEY